MELYFTAFKGFPQQIKPQGSSQEQASSITTTSPQSEQLNLVPALSVAFLFLAGVAWLTATSASLFSVLSLAGLLQAIVRFSFTFDLGHHQNDPGKLL
ncbi:MAG: hypothetical protein WCO14_01250 [bacterium]